jgi:hypothetical protein
MHSVTRLLGYFSNNYGSVYMHMICVEASISENVSRDMSLSKF